jgi:hypothetical protein
MEEQPQQQPQQQQSQQPQQQQLQPAQQPTCPTLAQRVASAVSGAVQRVEATWLSSAEKSEWSWISVWKQSTAASPRSSASHKPHIAALSDRSTLLEPKK